MTGPQATGSDRRTFLVELGVAASAVTLASCGKEQELSQIAGDPNDPSLQWAKAPCRYCGTGCGVEVDVKDGKVAAVRGDQESPVNKGLLCVKGYHLPAMLYGKDRLKFPMKRKADGKGFEKISWDEALDLIAEKFGSALKEHGPESVAMYGSG